MAAFNAAVVTEKGLELLAKVHSGTTDLIISAVVTGAGEYMEGEELVSRTALKDQRQSFAPTAIERKHDTEAGIRFSITNNPPSGPIAAGYNVTEIGIIATDPDDGDILYAIAVATADGSDYLPAYDGVVPAVIGAQFVIAVSNADTVIIHTDISAYATVEDLDLVKGRITVVEESVYDLTDRMDAAEEAIATFGPKAVSGYINPANWSNGEATVTAPGVKRNKNIMVVPSMFNEEAWEAFGVTCVSYADDSLTFSCSSRPDITLWFGVIVL